MTNEILADIIKLARLGAASLGHNQPVATMLAAWAAVKAAEQDLEKNIKSTNIPKTEPTGEG